MQGDRQGPLRIAGRKIPYKLNKTEKCKKKSLHPSIIETTKRKFNKRSLAPGVIDPLAASQL